MSTQDDAAVYRVTDEIALVLTADIITPPVDDPFVFGQIAAANALSDVYAMGGKPLVCLNLVGFPAGKLAPDVLHRLVAGALDKITEAGAVLAGGHTINDEEPKFGLSVAGLVHPGRYWANVGARAGDVLILTKPIGSGVLFNANRKGWVSAQAMRECVEVITTLNRAAAEVLQEFEVHAVTDVTGFGLAGHGLEMAQGSGVTMRIATDRVPVLREALAMYERGVGTGANPANRQMIEGKALFAGSMPRWREELWIDPQTSGGLLAAVPGRQGEEIVAALVGAGVRQAATIGTVEAYDGRSFLIFS
jgi:selenide,water dikinase